LRSGAEELPQKLPADKIVQPLQGLDEQIQKGVFGRWLRPGNFAGLGHQIIFRIA
jgi:hypothetical protein